MIKIENLTKTLEGKNILKNLSLQLLKGEIHVIYGKNGEGKSTLLKCISGLLKTNSGEIIYKNLDKKKIGIVIDNSLLINKLKVYEYLYFLSELKRIDPKIYINKVDSYLKIFNFLNEKNTYIEKLSKGTKSKLSLLTAVIFEPELLILDEPFTGMDIHSIKNVIPIIKNLAKINNTLVIISTHQIEVLHDLADKLSILKDGQITETINFLENNNYLTDNLDLQTFLSRNI